MLCIWLAELQASPPVHMSELPILILFAVMILFFKFVIVLHIPYYPVMGNENSNTWDEAKHTVCTLSNNLRYSIK